MADAPHTVEKCPQNPVINNLVDTLRKLEKHSERTTTALETIAAQGERVNGHDYRLDKIDKVQEQNDKKFDILFDRTVNLDDEIHKIKESRAKHAGMEIVQTRNDKFWDAIKKHMAPYIVGVVIFVLYVADKYDIPQKIVALIKEIKG